MLGDVDFSVGYREWAPPAALRDALACLWTRVVPAAVPGPAAVPVPGPGFTAAPHSELVLPDGCTDLIWERGSGAFVAGPDTGPVPTLLAPGTVLAAVRFRPGAGGALGIPLSELRDQRVDLADLRRDLDRLLPATLEPGDAAGALIAVAGRLTAERLPDTAMLQACRLLGRPNVRAEDVAGQVGLSGRQFRRRCEAAVGYGPKMLQRVLRFRRFVSLVDAAGGRAGLAQAALDSGYADQPHLTRETDRLAGLPPAALVRARRPG